MVLQRYHKSKLQKKKFFLLKINVQKLQKIYRKKKFEKNRKKIIFYLKIVQKYVMTINHKKKIFLIKKFVNIIQR